MQGTRAPMPQLTRKEPKKTPHFHQTECLNDDYQLSILDAPTVCVTTYRCWSGRTRPESQAECRTRAFWVINYRRRREECTKLGGAYFFGLGLVGMPLEGERPYEISTGAAVRPHSSVTRFPSCLA